MWSGEGSGAADSQSLDLSCKKGGVPWPYLLLEEREILGEKKLERQLGMLWCRSSHKQP